MRRFAFLAPLTLGLALAGAVQAQSADVRVSLGPDLRRDVDDLGRRDIDQQVARLQRAVERALARSDDFNGTRIELVLTELKPNRPTFEQLSDQPGLSLLDSISIGGAAIEGEVIGPDGSRRRVAYDRFSSSLAEVHGYSTWQDAERAYDAFARGLAAGRL